MDTIILITLIAIFLIGFITFYNNYTEYKKSSSDKDKTGYDSALEVVRSYNLDNYIIEKRGSFNDTYKYNKKVIKLSSLVFHDDNNYSVAMGYFIAMQAVLDKENNSLFKARKLFEPLYYALITASYLGLLLLAFSGLNTLFVITTLGLCILYQLVFLKQNIEIINRIKNKFVKNDNKLSAALDGLYIIDLAFGVLYIRVLIDNLIDLIKNR